MKLKELLKRLKIFNPNDIVMYRCSECGELSSPCTVGDYVIEGEDVVVIEREESK